jgi:segregation and condensation protein A
LLHLIERAELDITKLALAQITDQFLDYLEDLPDLSPDHVSEFLVIAAKLLQIKSEALLPRPPVRLPGEEDPGEALARQLMIYRQYKQIADNLRNRHENHYHAYLRTATNFQFDRRFDFTGLNLKDLVGAALVMNSPKQNTDTPISKVIAPPRVTIRQKIHLISSYLRQNEKIIFNVLVRDSNTRLDVVVSFLAILELVRLHLVKITQDDIFSKIIIEAEENWHGGEDLELEFGE